MQTDTQRPLPLLERRICSAPSLQSFEYSVLITTKASKLKKWYSDQPYFKNATSLVGFSKPATISQKSITANANGKETRGVSFF